MSLGTITVYKLIPTLDQSKVLYGFNNVPIASLDQTGSGAFDVSGYETKTLFGYIGSSGVSGSLVVSGSFDNSVWFEYLRSAVFDSQGSGSTLTLNDVVPYLEACLKNESEEAASGSLYFSVKV